MKKRLYFIRHGETEGNIKRLVQGSDSELSKEGIKQAGFIAERLRHLKFNNFFTSDYVRASDTAAVIAEAVDKTPSKDILLREMKRPSEFVGQSENSADYQEYLAKTAENIEDSTWYHSDEENFSDVLSRVEEFLVKVEKTEGDTLAVSHGRFIRMTALHIILGRQLTPKLWKQSMNNLVPTNTGITVFEYDEEEVKWQLRTFNDFAHFAE